MEKATIKRVETNDQAIRRLAALAQERGIQVFSYPRTNEFYATSRSNPETLHRVTAVSCDCEGFFAYQRCTHFAALLAHIGELPEPTTLAPVDLPAVVEARAELARLESLWTNHKLKSCDLRALQTARARYAELTTPATVDEVA